MSKRVSIFTNFTGNLVHNGMDQPRFVLSPEYQNHGYKAIYGYEYRYDDRSYGLNNGGYENGFTMSILGLGIQKIYNVTINKDNGMDWSLISWFLPSIINR